MPLHATHRPSSPRRMLVLEDGPVFRGESYGAEGETFGEAVFSTGMTGYQETLTDPSYHRQVVVMTAPHVGNTGMNDEDPESRRIWVAGYVVRDPARVPSSWRSRRSLDDELRDQGVVGISGIDTRALTRHLRERGAMRVGISSTETDPAALLARVLRAEPRWPAPSSPARSPRPSRTSCPAVGREAVHGRRGRPRHQGEDARIDGRARHRGARAARDRDARGRARRRARRAVLLQRPRRPGRDDRARSSCSGARWSAGCPTSASASATSSSAARSGFGTYKLKYGHRGINQPVMDRTTGKVEVTAHNHGFAVDAPLDAADRDAVRRRDGQPRLPQRRRRRGPGAARRRRAPEAFSVQYHPEAAAGPHDAAYLFDRFVRADGRGAGLDRLMPKRDRHRERPGDRLRARS